MTDAELMGHLEALGVSADNVGLVALLPLVQVAWCDGRVHRRERDVILAAARDIARLDDAAQAVLEGWLRKAPGFDAHERALAVLAGLASRHDSRVSVRTLSEVVSLCHGVAAAAGGLLGVAFTVDPREQATIEHIAQVLVADADPSSGSGWHVLLRDLEALGEAG